MIQLNELACHDLSKISCCNQASILPWLMPCMLTAHHCSTSNCVRGQVDTIVQRVTGFMDCTAREYERLYVQGVKQGLNLGEPFQEGECPVQFLLIASLCDLLCVCSYCSLSSV